MRVLCKTETGRGLRETARSGPRSSYLRDLFVTLISLGECEGGEYGCCCNQVPGM